MCGIMGVSLPAGRLYAAQLIYDGLRLLQHRGQDGAGMVLHTRRAPIRYRKLGLVQDVFSADCLKTKSGIGIGHSRYATQGRPNQDNLQPHMAITKRGKKIFVVSNGDIPLYNLYRKQLESQGVRFTSRNDAELLAWWLALELNKRRPMEQAIGSMSHHVKGAYSALVLAHDRLYAFRDPLGIRPMVTGKLPDGGVAFASETIALDILHAEKPSYQVVQAGAILEIQGGQIKVHHPGVPTRKICVFEYVYFARPDSRVEGLPIDLIRRRIGWRLSKHARTEIDVVVGVPDSATELARGVAEARRMPDVQALLRSHTARRTFIESKQRTRDEGVKYKLNPSSWHLEGQRVLLVDDSIVRGTTSRKIVRLIRNAGAKEVHLAIGSPPIKWSCFMGVATPTQKELVAHENSIESICQQIEADSLTFLPIRDLESATAPLEDWERIRHARYLKPFLQAPEGSENARIRAALERSDSRNRCYACFNGDYPLEIPTKHLQLQPAER